MSNFLKWIEKYPKKGVIFWIKWMISNINIKKEEIVEDESWKQIKLKSTVIPPFFPKNNNISSITLYLEVATLTNKEIWKRN